MADREEEIVARLRRGYEAFNRADFDTAIQMAHPEIEFIRPGGQSPVKGVEALRAWMEPEVLENQQIEPFEFRIEGDKVLVHQHNRARGVGSGIEMEVDTWSVWTLNKEGFATRLEAFLPHQKAEALEAAGIRE
jgi:limonene-1,2-epoxide hydrolase